ncbi:hypothetical protein [Afipia birgiae]|jgi:hypothetical protein|uniref:hypothetical protein n=1 Tax=Afipia birgiae TaxID=151414 RepID=UPI0002DBC7D0|nr:hypothetical protein [Afipia birgiae]
MTTIARYCILALVAIALGGCAYKPLKAPCSADEAGTPLAYTDSPSHQVPAAFTALDSCGPMRPI